MPWFSEEGGKVGECESGKMWKAVELKGVSTSHIINALSLSLLKIQKCFVFKLSFELKQAEESSGRGEVYHPQNNYISSGTRPYIRTLHKKSLTIKKFGELWHNQWRRLFLPLPVAPWDSGVTLTRWQQARQKIRYNSSFQLKNSAQY